MVIEDAGRAVAELSGAGGESTARPEQIEETATAQPKRKSILGAMKGQIWMVDDFDELGPEWDEYMR